MPRLCRPVFLLPVLKVFLLWCVAALVTGCASLPDPQPRDPTRALSDHQSTTLGRLALATAPGPNVSGFRLLVSGEEAFGALAALADQAERTLDLQYYLIRSESSSQAVMRRVRAAADRGVRVRLLLDDLNTAGQDAGLLRLTAHPNIEVRLYNPFPGGRLSTFSRVMASLTDMKRINHRMHNKMFVADNALAITGGRNLGDAYFLKSKESNFLDIDVVAAGPTVRALSATFDSFWNDPLAYPVAAVVGPAAMASSPGTGMLQADEAASALASLPASTPQDAAAEVAPTLFARELDRGQLRLVWTHATVLADKPSKMLSEGDPTDQEAIMDDLDRVIRSAKQEVILISPYFVPGERGVKLLKSLRELGVQVKILTNSLATTDAPVVHIGYARYRPRLLDIGVELHELRPVFNAPRSKLGSFGASQASLHAKVVVIDRKLALVGSMNLDPRSEKLNSEMGVVMRSPAIAQQLAQIFDEVSADSYHLSLGDDGRLRWTTTPPDPTLEGKTEPKASAWMKLTVKLLSRLAPEEML